MQHFRRSLWYYSTYVLCAKTATFSTARGSTWLSMPNSKPFSHWGARSAVISRLATTVAATTCGKHITRNGWGGNTGATHAVRKTTTVGKTTVKKGVTAMTQTFTEMCAESKEMAGVAAFFERRNKLVEKWWYFRCVLQGMYLIYVAERICDRRGHDLEDYGYAGPDSGAIDMHCHRCGKNWHEQLY